MNVSKTCTDVTIGCKAGWIVADSVGCISMVFENDCHSKVVLFVCQVIERLNTSVPYNSHKTLIDVMFRIV